MSQAPTSANAAAPISAPTVDPQLQHKKQRWELLNWARLSHRYYTKRQRFFGVCDAFTQIVCMLAGVAIFSEFFSSKIVGGVVTFISVLAFYFRYGDAKQGAIDLGRRCQQLVADIESVPASKTTQKQLASWARTRSSITGDEPPTLPTLAAQCEWEQCAVDGHPDHCARPIWLRRLFMHFI